jgi:DNA-binding MarR family transcriptional regulator
VDHDQLVAAIAAALAELQGAYDDRDRAMADHLGVGRTDLRCLDLIVRHGPQSATALGAQLHLTRGSMTALVDRLEKAGYVARRDDPTHGKRKLIVLTPRLTEAITPVVSAHRDRGEADLRRYTDEQLHTILEFLDTTLAAQATAPDTYRGNTTPD